jgi:hypothetical protein
MGEAMPPLRSFIPDGKNSKPSISLSSLLISRSVDPNATQEEESSDDEIETAGQTQNFICPISLVHLQDPVKSLVLFILHTIQFSTLFQENLWTRLLFGCD